MVDSSSREHKIQSKCYEHMSKIKKKLQGQKTVICCFLIENESEIEVVATGTGTKSLPRMMYDADGYLVRDMHAEVLARRALIRLLIRDAQAEKPLYIEKES